MKQITQLPDHFVERGSVNLAKNIRLLLLLQGIAVIALIITALLFLNLTNILRADSTEILSFSALLGFESENDSSFSITLSPLFLTSVLLSMILMIILHEAVHGLAFWLFTGKQPKYGFKVFYAYAASPEGVYLPRQQYFIVALAPLVILTLVGIVLIPIMPLLALPTLVFF